MERQESNRAFYALVPALKTLGKSDGFSWNPQNTSLQTAYSGTFMFDDELVDITGWLLTGDPFMTVCKDNSLSKRLLKLQTNRSTRFDIIRAKVVMQCLGHALEIGNSALVVGAIAGVWNGLDFPTRAGRSEASNVALLSAFRLVASDVLEGEEIPLEFEEDE